MTEEFLAEVAAEHRKGRRLLIGTTNLDAERQVIWDMGAIAVSREPESLELFRKMLLASAAIPAVFPPGFVKVAAEGGVYDEMHVDGGATREVFLVPTQFMAKKVDGRLGTDPRRRAYIVRNGRVAPEYKAVKPKTLSIAGRAVSSLIKSQGVGDLCKERDRLQSRLYPGRLPRHEHAGLRSRLYGQALRSRLPHGRDGIPLEEGPAAHGGPIATA